MTRLLRPGEVATELSVSRSQAYRLIENGDLPTVRIGTCVRVPAEALEAFIAARTTPARPLRHLRAARNAP